MSEWEFLEGQTPPLYAVSSTKYGITPFGTLVTLVCRHDGLGPLYSLPKDLLRCRFDSELLAHSQSVYPLRQGLSPSWVRLKTSDLCRVSKTLERPQSDRRKEEDN